MLQADIKVEDREGNRHHLTMRVHRQTPGPFANYRCIVADRQCLYPNYPRWSESATALVVRASSTLNIDELLPAGEKIARLKIRVVLVTSGGETPLAELRYRDGRLEIRDVGPPQQIRELPVVSGKYLVSHCLRLAAWGHDGEPQPPNPPQPPIQASPGSGPRYVRIAEIPEPARSGLESAIRTYGWGQPDKSKEGECVWLHDWERFLAG
jgi:hypothetical protein